MLVNEHVDQSAVHFHSNDRTPLKSTAFYANGRGGLSNEQSRSFCSVPRRTRNDPIKPKQNIFVVVPAIHAHTHLQKTIVALIGAKGFLLSSVPPTYID